MRLISFAGQYAVHDLLLRDGLLVLKVEETTVMQMRGLL